MFLWPLWMRTWVKGSYRGTLPLGPYPPFQPSCAPRYSHTHILTSSWMPHALHVTLVWMSFSMYPLCKLLVSAKATLNVLFFQKRCSPSFVRVSRCLFISLARYWREQGDLVQVRDADFFSLDAYSLQEGHRWTPDLPSPGGEFLWAYISQSRSSCTLCFSSFHIFPPPPMLCQPARQELSRNRVLPLNQTFPTNIFFSPKSLITIFLPAASANDLLLHG